MEFAGFDDDLFTETEEKAKKCAPISYNAKFIDSQWFSDNSADDPDDKSNRIRFTADYAYGNGNYQLALEKYKQCLDMLSENNMTVWRDINEAIALCYMHLNQLDEAVSTVKSVCNEAFTFEQKTSAWYMAAKVFAHFKLLQKELCFRQSLAMLHSSSPEMWRKLGDYYAYIQREEQSIQKGAMDIVNSDVVSSKNMKVLSEEFSNMNNDKNINDSDKCKTDSSLHSSVFVTNDVSSIKTDLAQNTCITLSPSIGRHRNDHGSKTSLTEKQFICFTRAKLLLEASSMFLTGQCREKNMEDQNQLDLLLSAISIEAKRDEKMVKMVRISIGMDREKVEELTDHELATQINPMGDGFCKEFEKKFFDFDASS